VYYESWNYDGDDVKAFAVNPFCSGAAERRFPDSLRSTEVVAFDRDWKRALSVTDDERLSIVSMETGEQLVTLDYDDSDAGPCPAFTSDGRFLLASDYDSHLFVFDSETGGRAYEIDVQENILQFILSEDMRTLYILDTEGGMRTWRVEYLYGMR